MTFCLAMRVEEGLIGIADTLITTGAEAVSARKVSVVQHGRHSMFFMTSGLRSIRDKALTYLDEVLQESDTSFEKLYQAVNAFAEQLRRVAAEDAQALKEADLTFNLHSLIGGQLEEDAEHKLYLLYPQGNWVEVTASTPYSIIGESSYAKPLLDRVLTAGSSMERALKVGAIAFDSTQRSATSVGFPMDVVLYRRDSYEILEARLEETDLEGVSEWWTDNLRRLVDVLPSGWVDQVLRMRPTVTPIRLPPSQEA